MNYKSKELDKLKNLYKALADVFDDDNKDIANFDYKLVEDLMAHIDEIQQHKEEKENA